MKTEKRGSEKKRDEQSKREVIKANSSAQNFGRPVKQRRQRSISARQRRLFEAELSRTRDYRNRV